MKYLAALIIAALVCSTAVAAPEPVTCDSPCDCHNAHGEGRWSVKTDASLPPTDQCNSTRHPVMKLEVTD
jgi:hypothetical protein